MRDYEVVYIFHPSLDEAGVDKKLDRFHKLVTGPKEARVSAVDHWGVRQLAYPIRKEGQGYYAVVQFTTEPDRLSEFERILSLDDDLMRFLVVLSEGEPTSGMSVMAETTAVPSDDDDDDDDEEDEDD
jgi:small subunit ribosomal protein S6